VKEFPKAAFDLETALIQRIDLAVNDRLNVILGQARAKMLHEARLSIKPRDQKDFERAAELMDMILDEVNRKEML
jgi:hypothetical protein